MTYSERIHQARIEYVDAAIGEIQQVCNVVEANPDNVEKVKQIAQIAGEHAQQKFEAFVQLVEEARNEN